MTTDPRVLATIDFSDASARAVAVAGFITQACQGTLTLLHAESIDAPLYFTNEQLGHLERERGASRAAAQAAVARFGQEHTATPFSQPLLVVRSELPHPIESLLARIVVLAERHVSGAGMLEYARALAARCGGMVFDERGAAIEVTLEQPRATLVVVPSPQPGNGHWPGRYAELIVRCCAAPVLFIPGFSEGATS